ncbi:MAG: universal stress protein [Acetivibrionales bacterium]
MKKNILVCVTQQKTCERLIHEASELRNECNGDLFVINVVKNDLNFLDSASESEALEYLFGISKGVGANLTVLKSDDVPGAIAQYANDNDIDCIILGKSRASKQSDQFLKRLKSLLKKGVEIRIVS